MLTIVYDPKHTNRYPGDNNVLEECKRCYNEVYKHYPNPNLELTFGNEMYLYAFRILVKRGIIPYNDIVFKFKDTIILIDENGRVDFWPKGFGDTLKEFLMELI
jgi:hypothetical protein